MSEPTERDREIAAKVVGLWKHTGDDLVEIIAYQLAGAEPAGLPGPAETDAILKGVLEEYVWRRDGIIGSADPEWFRHFLGERGYRLLLVAEEAS